MKKFLIIFLALFACAAATAIDAIDDIDDDVEELSEEQGDSELQEYGEMQADVHDFELSDKERGLILNAQARRAVKNFLKQMPCGFEKYGIPPLAPYTNPDLKLHLEKSILDVLLEMIRFRFDGLDKMTIKSLKVSYTLTKKVKFHFNFKELKATAQILDTNAFIDLMNELGVSVRYEGQGPLNFSLHDLSFKGQFKYKMPFLFGSIKIYKFECVVHLGGVSSSIGGILGNGRINRFINDQIEEIIPALINGHQQQISKKIEETVEPFVNSKMKGHKFWYVLSQLANMNSKCVPPPEPWMLAQGEEQEPQQEVY